MNRIVFALLIMVLATACGKKRNTCADVLCPGPTLLSIQVTDSEGRSLESNTRLQQYYNTLIIKKINYNDSIETLPTSYDARGIIQFAVGNARMYTFQYAAAAPDTLGIYQIIPLLAVHNTCCPVYSMFSVMAKDSTYGTYQGEIIKLKKPL